MAMVLAVPIGIWLMISSALYFGLWIGFIHRLGKRGIWLCNLGLSVVLSPGLVMGGHGTFPFPGGAIVLLGATSGSSEPFPSFNFRIWVLTFLIFSVFSYFLKKSDTDV